MTSTASLFFLGLLAVYGVAQSVAHNSSNNSKSDCNILCGRDYNPVCGGNLEEKRSFLNECELHAYNCRTKKELSLVDKSRVCPGDERLFE